MVLLGLWLALASVAWAAPLVEPPSGWAEGSAADPRARTRSETWARAWGAELRQVMSTRSRDDFAETLAVLDVAEPIPAEALADLALGRAWLEPRLAAALGPTAVVEGDALELRPRPEPGVAVLVARVRDGDRTARVAVAPTGTRHLALVLLVPAAEEVLHARVFDDAVEGLGDLRRPVAPFRHGLLRAIALASWLLVGSAFAFEWTRRALPHPGARVAGRQVAAALLVAAALALLVAGTLLGDLAVELSLAGTSPWGMAVEIALGGLAMAGLVLVATELWDRRVRPVASAPEAGTFARASAPLRRPVPSPVGSVPAPTSTPVAAGPPPPAVTGDTVVARRPPAVTGDTVVGRPPPVSGNTKVGPAPIPVEGYESGPPVREIISGDIDV